MSEPVLTFAPSPENFLVEEIPAYTPSGTGEHTFLWIEKRSLTTFDAVNLLARRLGVESREVGYAGMKDRHATTRQWISVPRVAPELALGAGDDQLQVLRAERHGNKLRVGHLHGNRFETVVGGLPIADDGTGRDRLVKRLEHLAAEGLPNRYGDQRFGTRADNTTRGLAVLRGEQRERDHRRRRLLLSAVQSAVFNQVLVLREQAGQLRRVLSGDVLQKSTSGGVFTTDDPATDQQRLDAGEVVVTGPMPGGWAREPPSGTEARAIEDQALAAVGASREEFSAVGRDLPGTRRPLLVPVTLVPPASGPVEGRPDAVRLKFQLPSGTYATVLLEALGVIVDVRHA
ncbi:MAG: tRNA pseudouridine(13) synthase TruD [Myxococcales bacterium]